MIQCRPVYAPDLEYRTRALIAGSAGSGFCGCDRMTCSLLVVLLARLIRSSLNAVSWGLIPWSQGSPLRGSSTLIEAGIPLGKNGSAKSPDGDIEGLRIAEALKETIGCCILTLGRPSPRLANSGNSIPLPRTYSRNISQSILEHYGPLHGFLLAVDLCPPDQTR